MKIFVYSTIISVLLWLVIQTTGYFLQSNVTILLIVSLYFWFFKKHLASAIILLETSLLIDLINYGNLPIYTLSSLAAGILYIELAEPIFTTNTTLYRTLGAIIWLLSWRIARLGWLAIAWLTKLHPIAPTNFSFLSWLNWLVIGLIMCLIVESIKKFTESRGRIKNQRSYA